MMSEFTDQHFDPEAPPVDPHVQGTSYPIISPSGSACPSTRCAHSVCLTGEQGDCGIPTGLLAQESQENPAVEDFGDSANDLWSLYVKEVKNFDKATVETIKDDMDGTLIFVRSYTST
jgi:hypothetical protein